MKISALSILCAVAVVDLGAAEMKTADDFRAAAEKANAVLTVPDWEQTPEAVEKAVQFKGTSLVRGALGLAQQAMA